MARVPALLVAACSLTTSVASQPLNPERPEAFVRNDGQWPSEARYLSRTPGVDAWVTRTGVVYDFYRIVGTESEPAASLASLFERAGSDFAPAPEDPVADPMAGLRRVGHVVKLEFVGASDGPGPVGETRIGGVHHYMLGSDRARWATGVPRFERTWAKQIYPGIDAVYYVDARRPRYDLVVRPGADPRRIRFRMPGASSVRATPDGRLEFGTRFGTFEQRELLAYQGPERRPVPCRYRVDPSGIVSFELGAYDTRRALTIDPIVWSTYLGGTGFDKGYGLAVDASGAIVTVGVSGSTNFPTTVGAYDRTFGGEGDVYVTKISADGSTLLWSTFIGGVHGETGRALALDASGSTILAGITYSSDFPTTAGAYARAWKGNDDGFVAKLSPDGSTLSWSTFFGGSTNDRIYTLTIDPTGSPTVGGATDSVDFPTTFDVFDRQIAGGEDAFIARLTSDGSALGWSSFIGGALTDRIYSLVVDPSGSAIVAGVTSSPDFPTTSGALDRVMDGTESAFVARVCPDGCRIEWSTFLGGDGSDYAWALAVDSEGVTTVGGITYSDDFPTTEGAFCRTFGGGYDGFVSRLSPFGTSLIWSTYLGGSNTDWIAGLTLEPNGATTVVGNTSSTNYPTTLEAVSNSLSGGYDAMVTRLSPSGGSLYWSSFLGGVGYDEGMMALLDATGAVTLLGNTQSANFPTTAGAYDRTLGGIGDVFLTRLSIDLEPLPTLVPDAYTVAEDATLTVPMPGVAANDQDAAGWSAHAVMGTQHGTLDLAPDGGFAYSPAPDFFGQDTFTYRLRKGERSSATQTVTIQVEPTDDPFILQGPDALVVDELLPIPAQFTANDLDHPGALVAFRLEGAPAGASIGAFSGRLAWTPSEEQGPGDYTFDVVATGSWTPEESVRKTVTVHVDEANSAPVFELPESVEIDELSAWTYAIGATDPDLPAQTLTYTLVSGPEGLALSPGGLLSWTPTEEQGPGSYTVEVSVSDGTQTSADTMAINVREANQPPQIDEIQDQSVVELQTLSLQVAARDADLPAQTLAYELASGPEGATLDADGAFSWTPTEQQGPGAYTVVVRVSDGYGSAEESFTVNVEEADQPPTLDLPESVEIDEMAPWTLQANGSDPDLPAQALTYTLVSGPEGLTLSASGEIAWTPTEEQGPGTYTLTVSVSDGTESTSDTMAINVREANQPPQIDEIQDQSVVELQTLSLQVAAHDADLPAQTLAYELASGPEGATLDADGAFSWTPTEQQGPGAYTVVVRVSDGYGSAEESFTVNVEEADQPPTLDLPESVEIDEMAPWTLQANGSDPDLPAQALTYTLVSGPEGLTLSASGEIAWTPTEEQGPGTYTLTVSVSDGTESASDTMAINVREANLPPRMDDVPSLSVVVGQTLAYDLIGTDPDLPAQTLTFALDEGPAGATLSAGGALVWATAGDQQPGAYTFRVSLTDGLATVTQSFTVELLTPNSPPTLDIPSPIDVAELTLMSVQAVATDPDAPAQTLTFKVESGPAGLEVSESGMITWTPTEEQGPGTYDAEISVTDGREKVSKTLTIHVSEVNLAPTLDLPESIDIDEMVEWKLQAPGLDADLPAQTLTYSLGSGPEGLTLSEGGEIAWTPTEEQGPGDYALTVTVSDGTQSATDTMTIHVREVNLPPSISVPSQPFELPEIVAASIQLEARDPDVPPNMLRWELVSGPDRLAVSDSGVLTWEPAEADGPGEYPVVVRVFDNALPALYDEQTILVRVTEVNSPPTIATLDPQMVARGGLLSVRVQASDPDLPTQTLVFTLENTVPPGATISEDGEFTWTPSDAQPLGSYDIHVKVTDSYGASAHMVFVATVESAESMIRGRVALLDFVGDPASQTTALTFVRASDGTLVHRAEGVALASDGAFALTLPAGTLPDDVYDVFCRAGHWLQKKLPGVAVQSQTTPELEFSLVNGDVDGDNVVTVFDYNALSDAFDSAEGDGNWNPNADLDGDGVVTVFDYNILSQNFDLSGDE